MTEFQDLTISNNFMFAAVMEDTAVSYTHLAMYAVGEETNGQIYYTTEDGNKVYLKSDEDGDNQGEATIFIDGAAGGRCV